VSKTHSIKKPKPPEKLHENLISSTFHCRQESKGDE
jgi:hypothetical protein